MARLIKTSAVPAGLMLLALLTTAQASPKPTTASTSASSIGAPGGHRVVWQADPDGDGNPQIFTCTLEDPTAMAVTPDVAKDPSIARNGDIYYTRSIAPPWGEGGGSMTSKIFHRMGPKGAEMDVTRNPLADETDPYISRDDQFLAFTTVRYFQPTIGVQTNSVELMAYQRPFVEQKQLTRSEDVESDPSVDANGTWFYCTIKSHDHNQVWRFRWFDTHADRVAGLESGKNTECSQPSVDGQDRWCAYASARDGNSEIYVRDLKTKVETRLTNDKGFDGEPAMTEDGSKIVFVSDRDGDKDLYVMNRDGSGLKQLTNNTTADEEPSVQ